MMVISFLLLQRNLTNIRLNSSIDTVSGVINHLPVLFCLLAVSHSLSHPNLKWHHHYSPWARDVIRPLVIRWLDVIQIVFIDRLRWSRNALGNVFFKVALPVDVWGHEDPLVTLRGSILLFAWSVPISLVVFIVNTIAIFNVLGGLVFLIINHVERRRTSTCTSIIRGLAVSEVIWILWAVVSVQKTSVLAFFQVWSILAIA